MKELTLDLKKWRCGGYGENKLGEGETLLLNSEGYMCCLGQFSEQLGVKKKYLLATGEPDQLPDEIAPKEFVDDGSYLNNELATAAIAINDDESLTTEQRISELKELFAEHGFEIKVINQ